MSKKYFFILFQFLIVSVVVAQTSKSHSQLILMGSWNEAITGEKAIYGCKEGVYRPLLEQLAFETPNPFAVIPHVGNTQIQFKPKDAKKMAMNCRARFSNSFDLVGCASKSVHEYFKGKVFTGINSSCRSHTYAFNEVFSALNIPRSNSSILQVAGKFHSTCDKTAHVLNRFVLVAEDGQPYSYAIDSDWFPGKAFPLTDMTVKYHENGNPFPNLSSTRRERCKSVKSSTDVIREMLNGLK
ncbi:hypothetical protein [Bdellovibrio sp. HCB-110]|uniref:hypothetical protein n=1 Tax=Bdellovibrio sp. HCB-110 TaxID=3391182 RepID=UPI0039B3AD80